MTEINMIKKPCPQPVIEAKKILIKNNNEGVILRVDNLPAVKNLEKLAASFSSSFTYEKLANNDYRVNIGKIKKSDVMQAVISKNLVVTISSNKMGSGADELGQILIKSFIYSLTELDIPPTHIIFFNSGVKLTCMGSNTIDTLNTLKKDVLILSCGTCLNYYDLTDKLAIGEIANMYEITEILSKADKIINL
ncbi:MAG: sulfurtransferase-like selenium metabolism protein YedF [Firmicutes bacterium]|nr:sulfurtransferase-like selenium metabolism protein YedF [Bacillota bacterium]